MSVDLTDAQQVLACLGDPSRFRIVAVLADGDRCVTEIATQVGLSQSCTTRHLQVLLRRDVVARVRQGKRVRFHLRDDDPAMSLLLEWALLRSPGLGAGSSGDAGDGADRHCDAGSSPYGVPESTGPTASPNGRDRVARPASPSSPTPSGAPVAPRADDAGASPASAPEASSLVDAGELEDYLL